jgi:hypothetical protein
MAANSKGALHVDAYSHSVYNSEDMNYFQNILSDILDSYGSGDTLSLNEREYLKTRLAAAIFKCAEQGERDYMRLKQSAIEAVSATPLTQDPEASATGLFGNEGTGP